MLFFSEFSFSLRLISFAPICLDALITLLFLLILDDLLSSVCVHYNSA